MFNKLKGKYSVVGPGEEPEEEEAADEAEAAADDTETPPSKGQRPVNWFFNGWYAFLLYGPFAPPDKQINFIKLGDPNKDVSNGRAALRAKEAKDNNEQRARDTGRYKDDPKVGLKERIALASLDEQAHRDVQTRKEAQLISIKMQLEVVGRQIERADKKGDNAKVEELEMKEEKLSTMMATIMDPTPEKEVRPRSWNTLVEDTMGKGKLPSAKKLKFKASYAPTTPAPTTLVGTTTPAPFTLVGTTSPSARQATHLDFTNEDDEGSETDLTPLRI
jgi:hypothetical protein